MGRYRWMCTKAQSLLYEVRSLIGTSYFPDTILGNFCFKSSAAASLKGISTTFSTPSAQIPCKFPDNLGIDTQTGSLQTAYTTISPCFSIA